jgi:RimJ/RimL family protein N-acetyltransferase
MAPLPGRATGPRLLLRRYVAADVDHLAAVIGDNLDHLRPYLAWIRDEPLDRAARLELVEGWERAWLDGGDVVFGAFVGDELVGGTGLHRRLGPDTLEIGYWISRHHVRRGYASELGATLTDLAFTVPGIEAVEIHHDVSNVASEGVPRSLGFEPTGEVPSQREHPAPAETGRDRVWRVGRERWAKMRA